MFGKFIEYFLVQLLLYQIECKPKEIKCPDYCECDVYERLRRAVCRNRKLYSVEIDMPAETQILDLSYNQISELGNGIFLEIGLTNLKLLNFSHNKLGHVHLNGFEGLSDLKTLDMSFNMIRYFSEQWFVSLSSLQELYLRGNNLASINDEPQLKLPKLKILDISFCAIESIHPGIFENLPNLRYLDISENYLTQLSSKIVEGLYQLKYVNLKGNPIKCKDLYHFKYYVNTNGISYDDSCQKTGKKNKKMKFERIVALVTPDSEKNGWMYDPDEETKIEVKVVEVCNVSGNKTNTASNNQLEIFIMEVVSLSPLLFLAFTLVFGITLGMVIGCSCEIGKPTYPDDDNLPPYIPPSYRRTDNNPVLSRGGSTLLQRENSNASSFRPRTTSTGSRRLWRQDRNLLLMNEYNLSDSTPVLPRKYVIS